MRKADWAIVGAKVNVRRDGYDRVNVYEIVRITPSGQIVLDDGTRFYPGELGNNGTYSKASKMICGRPLIMSQRTVPVTELTDDNVGQTITACHRDSGDYVTGELIAISTHGHRPGVRLEIDVPGTGVVARFFRTIDVVVLHGN